MTREDSGVRSESEFIPETRSSTREDTTSRFRHEWGRNGAGPSPIIPSSRIRGARGRSLGRGCHDSAWGGGGCSRGIPPLASREIRKGFSGRPAFRPRQSHRAESQREAHERGQEIQRLEGTSMGAAPARSGFGPGGGRKPDPRRCRAVEVVHQHHAGIRGHRARDGEGYSRPEEWGGQSCQRR